MTENTRRYRADRKPPNKKKGDKLLNYLISIVVILIFVVAGFIFFGDSTKKVANNKVDDQVVEQPKTPAKKEEPKKDDQPSDKTDDKKDEQQEPNTREDDNNTELKGDLTTSDTAKVTPMDDAVVKEVIEDSSWTPFKTKQQDDGTAHNSSYDEKSLDWQEKIAAISAVTDIAEADLIVWFMKNGGSADSAIGTVSSKDKSKMYRVSIKWVTKEGWLPTKVETLKQIKGAY